MQKLKNFIKRHTGKLLIILILLGIAIPFVWNNGTSQISYTDFVSYVEEGKVESITLNSDGKKAEVKLKDEESNKKVIVPSVDSITELLTQNEQKGNHIKFEMKEEGINIFSTIISILSILIYSAMFMLFIFIIKSVKNQLGNTNVSKVEVEKNIKVRFDDIAGIEEQKEELTEIVDFLKNPKKYREIGARTPKGILLSGEPGTGKTLLAKAIAGEAGVSFFNMNGSEFEEMFVGLGAARVRSLFEKARKNSPSIVFIDEIDSIGGKRGGRYNYSEQTLNQLLVEMDGFKDDDVVVIAATNRIDSLDLALLRPGRFDRKIYVPKPDIKGREEILKIHSAHLDLGDDINLKEIAAKTAGYTGAELANVTNEAAIIAVRNNHSKVMQKDINEALRKQLIGVAQKNRVISDKVKKLVSYHEAGHALVSTLLGESSKVVEISIVSRGRAGGYTMYEDCDDNIEYLSSKECLKKICSLLAGRAAESIILKDISTGAQNDLEKATRLVTLMVTKYGMSNVIGPMALTDEEIMSLNKDFNNPISAEIKRILTECNKKTEEILNQNVDLLHKVANVLAEKETISGEEFLNIIN